MKEKNYRLTEETYNRLLNYCHRYNLEDGERFLVCRDDILDNKKPMFEAFGYDFLCGINYIDFIEAISYMKNYSLNKPFNRDNKEYFKEMKDIVNLFDSKKFFINPDKIVSTNYIMWDEAYGIRENINYKYVKEVVTDLALKSGFIMLDKNKILFTKEELCNKDFIRIYFRPGLGQSYHCRGLKEALDDLDNPDIEFYIKSN